ncbi:hypothetical protein [uncultured Thiodictyon sp.]|uniref:hypothetical protein n=1 Tax=uncultured Thiodictyon sp. TaxID=1846217 RepID=UPI0025E9CDB5|nr:hypothetical protein [uncultured Thiodictyon sp.]
MNRLGPLEHREISIADVVRILDLLGGGDQIALDCGLEMIGVTVVATPAKAKVVRRSLRHQREHADAPDWSSQPEMPSARLEFPLDPVVSVPSIPRVPQPATDLPPTSRLPARVFAKDAGMGGGLRFVFADDERQHSAPLLEPHQERNTLRELCAIPQPSREIDVMALYRQVTQGEPVLGGIPRRWVKKPARRILIAADVNPRMAVFASDVDHIADILGHATNSEVKRQGWLFVDEVARIAPRRECVEGRTPVSLPGQLDETALLLLASDLGFGDWGNSESWRLPTASGIERLVSRVGRNGARLAALVPVRPAGWRRLPRGLRTLYWDRRSTPSAARRATAAAEHRTRVLAHPTDDGPALGGSRLVRACVFAGRVTPRLLRALRLAMLPLVGPEAEAQAWCSPYLYPTHGGFASVDHSLLADEAHRSVSWTRLSHALRAHGRGGLIEQMGGERPLGHRDDSLSLTLGACEWGRARACLAQELGRDPNLLRVLTTGDLWPWAEELTALRDGQGGVFLEQAWEITQAESTNHPLPFRGESAVGGLRGRTGRSRCRACSRPVGTAHRCNDQQQPIGRTGGGVDLGDGEIAPVAGRDPQP